MRCSGGGGDVVVHGDRMHGGGMAMTCMAVAAVVLFDVDCVCVSAFA